MKSTHENRLKSDSASSFEESKESRDGNDAFRVSRKKAWLERLVLIVAGAGFAAAFPDLNFSFLGWIGLVPLYWVIRDKRPLRAWRCGFLWGYAWSVTAFFWLREIELFIPWLLSLVLALFPAFWAALVPFLRRHILYPVSVRLRGVEAMEAFRDFKIWRELLFIATLAFWWCFWEWVRSWIGTGLPWNYLAASQWKNIPLIQICEFTGVYGVSFLLAMVNFSIARTIEFWVRIFMHGGKYRRPVPLIVSLLLVMLAVLIGSKSMLKYQNRREGERLVAAVLQGDVPQCRQATIQQAERALKSYLELSDLAVVTKPGVVIWPETAVPYPFLAAHGVCDIYRRKVFELVEKSKVPFLIGTIDYGALVDGEGMPAVHNSAFLINRPNAVADRFNKVHRVPFGEFVPFSRYFPWLVKWIGMGRDLTPGKRFNVITIRSGVKAGVNICFEDVFPYVSRNEAKNGANILIVLTNDAWYPKSSEPEQHLANAVFRAVETRLPMIRCGNNSCSVLVQPNGAITDSIFVKEDPKTGLIIPEPAVRGKGYANFSVWLDPEPEMTFYTRFGDLFILLSVLSVLSVCIFCLLSWRREKEKLVAPFE